MTHRSDPFDEGGWAYPKWSGFGHPDQRITGAKYLYSGDGAVIGAQDWASWKRHHDPFWQYATHLGRATPRRHNEFTGKPCTSAYGQYYDLDYRHFQRTPGDPESIAAHPPDGWPAFFSNAHLPAWPAGNDCRGGDNSLPFTEDYSNCQCTIDPFVFHNTNDIFAQYGSGSTCTEYCKTAAFDGYWSCHMLDQREHGGDPTAKSPCYGQEWFYYNNGYYIEKDGHGNLIMSRRLHPDEPIHSQVHFNGHRTFTDLHAPHETTNHGPEYCEILWTVKENLPANWDGPLEMDADFVPKGKQHLSQHDQGTEWTSSKPGHIPCEHSLCLGMHPRNRAYLALQAHEQYDLTNSGGNLGYEWWLVDPPTSTP